MSDDNALRERVLVALLPVGTPVLSEPLVEAAERLGFETGYDDDDDDKHQFVHICWAYQTSGGALCGSKRLWFNGPIEHLSRVTCAHCHASLLMLLDGLDSLNGPVQETVRKAFAVVREIAAGLSLADQICAHLTVPIIDLMRKSVAEVFGSTDSVDVIATSLAAYERRYRVES